MKICTDCKIEKDIDDFPWKNKAKGWRLGRCKPCYNAWFKKYFDNSYEKKKKHQERVKLVNKKQLLENRIRALEYLKQHPCVDCGEANPIVLDFDHKDPQDKAFNVCQALVYKSYTGWHMIEQEIEKCDIRCANCHRIKTAKQFGYWKHSLLEESK